jgi:hypothetical protein
MRRTYCGAILPLDETRFGVLLLVGGVLLPLDEDMAALSL